MLSAASALDWVARLTGQRDLPRLVASAKARGLSKHAPFFLPYLSGERTPHNDPNSRGVFFGIDADTSAADLTLLCRPPQLHLGNKNREATMES